jgi:hypothetical protein
VALSILVFITSNALPANSSIGIPLNILWQLHEVHRFRVECTHLLLMIEAQKTSGFSKRGSVALGLGALRRSNLCTA